MTSLISAAPHPNFYVYSSTSQHVVEVLSSQPVINEAADTLAVKTVESVIESVISESVDTSSGVEAVTVVENTECSNRDSTFITEIEDTEEIPSENFTEQESANKLNQLEKSIEESEKEFPIEESIGAIEEVTPSIEDKCTDIVESIEEGVCVADDFKESVTKEDAFKEESKGLVQNETEYIEPVEADINNDNFVKEIDVTEGTESILADEETEAEADIIADEPSIEN